MLKEKEAIIKLYQLYGFKLVEQTEEYLVFIYCNYNYFYSAEIVQLKKIDIQDVFTTYKEQAYCVTVIECYDFNSKAIHNMLFKRFFKLEQNKEKFSVKYAERYHTINKLPNDCCNYIIGDSLFNDNSLTNLMLQKISEEGPKLTFLNTNRNNCYKNLPVFWELCYYLLFDVDEPRMPLVVNLANSNDKTLPFKYTLLSEIDDKFPTLSSKMIDYEIREGNVPLIISNFEKLLSSPKKEDACFSLERAKIVLDEIISVYLNDDESPSNAKIFIISGDYTNAQFSNYIRNKNLSDSVITEIEELF